MAQTSGHIPHTSKTKLCYMNMGLETLYFHVRIHFLRLFIVHGENALLVTSPPHFSVDVRQVLNNRFRDRWTFICGGI